MDAPSGDDGSPRERGEERPVPSPGDGDGSTVTGLDLLLVAAVVVLWIEAFGRVLTRVFVLNFSTAGPNLTALLLLLLVTGWAVPLAARVGPRRGLAVSLFAGLAGLAVSAVGHPVVAGLGAAVAVTGLTTVLVGALVTFGRRVAVGAGLGVAVHTGLRAALDTAPTYATTAGRLALGLLALVAVGAWLALGRTDDRPTLQPANRPLAPLGVFLVLEGAVLVAAGSLAAWAGRPFVPVAVATLAGAVAGAYWVHRAGLAGRDDERRADRPSVVTAEAVLVLSVAALLWLDGWGIPFAASAQFGAVVLLAAGSRRRYPRSPRAAGAGLGVAQFVAVVLLFLVVAAANWAYMPAPLEGLVRGADAVFVLALAALLPLVVHLTGGRGRSRWTESRQPGRSESRQPSRSESPQSSRSESPQSRMSDANPLRRGGSGRVRSAGGRDGWNGVSTDRRTALALAAGGLVGLAGVAIPGSSPPPSTGTPPPLRAMTYNLHQYLAGDGTGRHTLEPLAALLRRERPHLVGLQETEGNRVTSGNVDGVRWLAERLGYHALPGPPTRAGGYGVALLSAWPVARRALVPLPVHDSPPRWMLVADVDAPFGRLPVLVTHFQTAKPGDERLAEAGTVVDAVGRFDRAVVMGDFNARPTPGEPVYERLVGVMDDAWVAAGNARDGGPTYSASDPHERIDYVFLRGDWRVERARTLGSDRISDHLAVGAVLIPR